MTNQHPLYVRLFPAAGAGLFSIALLVASAHADESMQGLQGDREAASPGAQERYREAIDEERRTPGEYLEDAAIAGNVKTRLLLDDEIKGLEVQVSTKRGVVHLAGEVESEELRDRIISIAEAVDNVKEVNDDKLVVKEEG
ncbi:BON domain-containing protein [Thioalkalicoccus limnaeus]|uniref:BON domain-containing protein n=1 Tax=Thioalkalicoccus limnaeus TaxID=120681 RepID=A0ABV4BIE8_9GAMM